MKIIALRGTPDSGKTTTLKAVYGNLKASGYSKILYESLSNGDFRAVLSDIHKNILVIVSQGDYARGDCSVKHHIEWALIHQPIILICACTIGPSKSRIQKWINEYNPIYIDKTITSLKEIESTANKSDADVIVSYVKSEINSRL